MIDYLTRTDLVHLNERTIKTHGGHFEAPENLADEETLIALLDAICTDDFPHLSDKAAAYFHGIITNKVFQDANARTALLAARTFVLLNGGAFHKKLKAVEADGRRVPAEGNGREMWLLLVNGVVSEEITVKELQEWMKKNIREE